jgi:uncharacterized protein (TIGR02300 family)
LIAVAVCEAGRITPSHPSPAQDKPVARTELGTKRICAGCSAKFYDLQKTPIVCPTCETVFVVPKPPPVRPRRVIEPEPASVPKTTTEELQAVNAGDARDSDDAADTGVPMLEELDEE